METAPVSLPPSSNAEDDCTSTAPPTPDTADTLPLERSVTWPLSSPVPASMCTDPAWPASAAPVAIVMSPDDSSLAAPEDTSIAPDLPPSDDTTRTLPDDASSEAPLSMTTLPPSAWLRELTPLRTTTSPALPLPDDPTESAMPPARPALETPVAKRMSPEAPSPALAPVSNDIAPLAPLRLSAVATVTSPLAKPAPLVMETLPPALSSSSDRPTAMRTSPALPKLSPVDTSTLPDRTPLPNSWLSPVNTAMEPDEPVAVPVDIDTLPLAPDPSLLLEDKRMAPLTVWPAPDNTLTSPPTDPAADAPPAATVTLAPPVCPAPAATTTAPADPPVEVPVRNDREPEPPDDAAPDTMATSPLEAAATDATEMEPLDALPRPLTIDTSPPTASLSVAAPALRLRAAPTDDAPAPTCSVMDPLLPASELPVLMLTDPDKPVAEEPVLSTR